MPDDSFPARAAAEIDALHRLLQAWFRAEGEADPAPILAHFDEGYTMVTPLGTRTGYAPFREALPGLRGSRPTLVMEIFDVVVQHAGADSALVTYRERQTQDSGSNERLSTALLLHRPDRPTPVWRHLQETWKG
ncbi:nuclear transport factor 2 family protein [Roseomonas sp. NAR14]|uniref:Nuclear transport factor 2 family protein n=1 Tax=Roseomonas acroporae TaxID=2937791 RepID=A0A9X1Y9E2_9PROT|nr:nuclear transport factor 2 family protein [Roseomonas acroporae]MCK8785943.1 nuclear transport factor 2 family protein [Roseomonas acroporae]